MKARFPPGPANTMSRGSSPTSSVRVTIGTAPVLAGSDDRMWPSVRMATLLGARLERHDHPNYETVVYDGSGHRMRYALWPDQHEPSRFVGGGSPEANHVNGGDGWQRIKAFFGRELKRSAGG